MRSASDELMICAHLDLVSVDAAVNGDWRSKRVSSNDNYFNPRAPAKSVGYVEEAAAEVTSAALTLSQGVIFLSGDRSR